MHIMKSKSIKTSLPRLAGLMILLFLMVILPFNLWLQIVTQHHNQLENAQELFGQLEHIIEINDTELDSTKNDFKSRCIQSADVVAFYVMRDKSIMHDIEATRDLAHKLNVDEIHYFTPNGEIFFGTHPKYYGYTFSSGEQMNFFEPMLHDKTLKLCQDIVPNTAESKQMQYAAVWLEDGSGIVQIGMEPLRLQEEMAEKDLSKTISSLPIEMNGYLHIVDKKSHIILASNVKTMIDQKMDPQVQPEYVQEKISMVHYTYNGKRFCVYTKAYGDYIFVRTYESMQTAYKMIQSSLLMIIYTIIASIGIILIIRWYIKHKLILNLDRINTALQRSEQDGLREIELHTEIIEFNRLLSYINQMIRNTRSNWKMLSYIMNKEDIPIGIFAINSFYKKTFMNQRLYRILEIDEHDKTDFMILLNELEKHTVRHQTNLYQYDIHGKTKYIRMEKIIDEQNTIYYLTDVTLWWNQMNQIKEESGHDELTGLYNRRGFYQKMDMIFQSIDPSSFAAMIMIDADNLKIINDSYGHKMGDHYLNAIATSMKNAVGKTAICGRLGGDEFAIFVYDCRTMDELNNRVQLLKEVRGQVFEQLQQDFGTCIQFSIGIAIYPKQSQDFHNLLRIADEDMYKEKKVRKNMN